jgi:transcription elongation GreA/GreB family factor
VSRAFVKETDVEPVALPDRPVSPHPNFVTPEGLAAIERELARLDAVHAAAVAAGDTTAAAAVQRDQRYWTARRASAQVIVPPPPASSSQTAEDKTAIVQFGATVTVRRHNGHDAAGRTQTFHIVGEDEADPSHGTLSHVAPLARALFGKAVGDTVEVAGGEAEILAIK